MIEKEIICPSCGYSGKWLNVQKFPQFMFGIPFSIVRCPICGLGRTIPSPSSTLDYYEDNQRNTDLFTERKTLYYSFAKNLFTIFESQIKEPDKVRLLDIGCGGGFCVEYADNQGYYAQGLETNTKMVDWCRERGLNVIKGDANHLEFSKGLKFNVVILSSILEHLEDPLLLLKNIRKNILTENGIVVLSQANYMGFLPRVFPWGWYGWQPQEHFWHFTVNSIREFSKQSGFSVALIKRDTLYHPWFKYNNIKEFIGRNFAAILARIGLHSGLGDNLVVIIKPRISDR